MGSSDSALIASPAQCPGATSSDSTAGDQRRALLCLINYARTVTGLRPVKASRTLFRVAHTKGLDIASCHDFDHAACGQPPFAHIRSSGYRFRLAGENLFAAERPIGTAQDVLVAWLHSPTHRRLLFVPRFREAGIALLRLDRLAETSDVHLWVLELAQRR